MIDLYISIFKSPEYSDDLKINLLAISYEGSCCFF